MNKKDLVVIKDYARANGGCSLNASGKVITLQDGYMVSKREYEHIYSSIEELDLETLNNYLMLANKLNKSEKHYKCFIGLWISDSDNKCYLDISMKISNRQLAISIAKQEKQLAIYDNVNRVCITM